MATAKMHFQPPRRRRDAAQSREAALRVLQLQRAGDVLPALLAEIVALGYPRAAVFETDPETGEASAVATLNWPPQQMAKLTAALRGSDLPLKNTLAANRPAVVLKADLNSHPLSLHPMLYSSAQPCWEAPHANSGSCLAAQNGRRKKNPSHNQQSCPLCSVRGYAAIAVVEVRRQNSNADLAALNDLIRLANGHLSSLVKGEHYYNRMRHLESLLAEELAAESLPQNPEALAQAHHEPASRNKSRVERRLLEIEKFASAGRLAATIAHEVNNPMEAIKNAVYLLGGAVPESSMPVYNILKSETERVARVVRQMLGLYRDTEPAKAVNVNTLIEDTLLLLNRQLQRANVQVAADLGVLPDAVIAADQIRQVFSNLVINARDAMPKGGTLRIRTRHIIGRDQASSWVRVLVADNGTGIPREILGDIFEPFVTTKGEKGTGLGLWIVKGIIQNHAGKITVRSRLGSGTVFRIDLPIARP